MTETILRNVLSAAQRAWEHARLSAWELVARSRPPDHLALLRTSGSRRLGRYVLAAAGVGGVVALACGGLYWRLGSGPLSIDMATPWLTTALEERLGPGHRVEVGGTVLERDEEGRTAVRLRDVVVRDAGGLVVATAPRAEVGITGTSLLIGQIRAERVSLIGAEMAVRIEPSGDVRIFAAAKPEGAPASAAAPVTIPDAPIASVPARSPQPSGQTSITEPAAAEPSLVTTAVDWLRTLDTVGLDGRDLMEVGLKSGSLVVDDQRTGRQIKFDHINLSLTRLKQGGIALAISSVSAEGPWSINASVTPRGEGRRAVEAVIRDVSPRDIMLALRTGGSFQADLPLSAVVRAEFAADGMPTLLQGRILGGAGHVGDVANGAARVLVDELQAELRWDASNQWLQIPIELHAGSNRLALMAQVEPPRSDGQPWAFSIVHGMVLLASLDSPREPPLILDRINVRASMDWAKRQLLVQQADVRGAGGGVWFSGGVEFGGDEPRLTVGVAGTRMGAVAFKRLWPVFIAPELRSWIDRNLQGGNVERISIATNMPLAAVQPNGPALTEEALSIEIESKGTVIRPVNGLPPIQDATLVTHVTGRAATITVARGKVQLPSGRALTLSDGRFHVPDINMAIPQGQAQFGVEGPVEAVAELLSMEPVRDAAAMPFDVGAARGAVSAQVSLALPLSKDVRKASVNYAVEAEIAGFSADKFWRGQKAESALLRIVASDKALHIRGDVRIGGTPAAVDYRRPRDAPDAELRINATLDEAARTRLGLDLGGGLAGPVPVKVHGRVNGNGRERDGRLSIEADLSQARVQDLIPGWTKAPGRAARAAFTLVHRGDAMRLEDFVLDGAGASVRGSVDLDAEGELEGANFPNFALSDGDKATLKAERTADGTLRLVLRGDVYDGRGLIKSSVSGKSEQRSSRRAPDLDLDIKVGAMTGHHGETLRSLELRLTRRGGQIRTFTMSGRLGRDARIRGDLRARGPGRHVMYLETGDAGALFRFTDIYPRILGGSASIAMDPPVLDNTPREGLLNIRDFSVRGERALEQVASSRDMSDRAGARPMVGSGVSFSGLRAEFTRSPGRFAIRDGVVWGPAIGATVEGGLDYARDEVRLRGTFVPAYAINNILSRVPVLGFFLGGGENEGLLGVTYQVVGSPSAPVLQVNPISAIAPGFLRKLFEYRDVEGRASQAPEQVR